MHSTQGMSLRGWSGTGIGALRNLVHSRFSQVPHSLQLRYDGHDFRHGSPLTSLNTVRYSELSPDRFRDFWKD